MRAHAAAADTATRWRRWIERVGVAAATPRQPVWSSRQSWLDSLRDWAQSRALATVCIAERASITATTLLAIAAVMAEHADHATGRHVAITRATIAERIGCHPNTVSTAWAVLRASGWAVEAQRGHGSPGTPSVGRRPSVYHLVQRRPSSVPVAPKPVELRGIEPLTSGGTVENCDLPPSGGVGSLTPVGSNSPSAYPREENSTRPLKSRRWRAEPRPLALQQLAARLANCCHGLRSGHIGAICDAIAAVGIDPTVWSAADIKQALEADMRRTGGTWPDQITNPGGFLASRLRKLGTFTDRTPARAAAMSHPSVPSAPPSPTQPALSSATNTGTGRVEAFAELAAARRRALHRRTAAAAADTARRDALIATIRAATPPGRSTTVWR
ncbi:hypothetical protein MTY66_63750 (plasmid) [Mycolicibacterium sp. TY66]|nr:hypothetical protein MTY66_63750 [Mycolicibacterium sp. TY66]BCJ84964.1 hypothetical protein MTY81_63370 [Mycolicibacterium sp. TY81]